MFGILGSRISMFSLGIKQFITSIKSIYTHTMVKMIGTNAEVFQGLAKRTRAGWTKGQLMMNALGQVKVKPAARRTQGGVITRLPSAYTGVPHPIQVGYSGGSLTSEINKLVGAGIGGGATAKRRKALFNKILNKFKRAARTVIGVATGAKFEDITKRAIALMKSTGIPQAQIAAMKAEQFLPFIQETASIAASAIGGRSFGGRSFVGGMGVRLP